MSRRKRTSWCLMYPVLALLLLAIAVLAGEAALGLLVVAVEHWWP